MAAFGDTFNIPLQRDDHSFDTQAPGAKIFPHLYQMVQAQRASATVNANGDDFADLSCYKQDIKRHVETVAGGSFVFTKLGLL
jgi:hypothetical protein